MLLSFSFSFACSFSFSFSLSFSLSFSFSFSLSLSSVKSDVCGVFRQLACNNESNAVLIGELGGPLMVVDTMKCEPDDREMQVRLLLYNMQCVYSSNIWGCS